jgi:exodeoxyribonuclease VII large subunit
LFAPERKRPLPRYPRRIGLVTSPTGAALRDVLHVIQRRNPALEIILAPCRVQGEGAAAEIAAAIRLLNELHHSAFRVPRSPLDLILVTRGGGSLEDLWAFNEEAVARALFESVVPVVSAVGHEIDFTISDFVADVRAATPSAAAELITEGVFSRREFVADSGGWLLRHVRQQVDDRRADLEQRTRRLARMHPRRQLNDRLQHLDDLRAGLLRSVRQGWRAGEAAWRQAHQRLLSVRPAQLLTQRRHALREGNRRLREQARHALQQVGNRLAHADARLRLLSPANVLERGYSITREAATGRVVREATTVHPGVRLRTQLARGEIDSVVAPTSEPPERNHQVLEPPPSA